MSLLERLQEAYEMRMNDWEDGRDLGPVKLTTRGEQLVSDTLPAFLALVEEAQRLSESYSDRDSPSWSRFRAALSEFLAVEGQYVQ